MSRQTLMWATGIAWRGFLRPLAEEDLPDTPHVLAAHDSDVSELGAKLWAEEIAVARQEGRTPRLSAMWRRLAMHQWLIGGALGFTTGFLTTVARPLVLRELIFATSDDSSYDLASAYMLAISFFLVVALEAWTRSASRYYMGDVAPLMAVSATIQLVATQCTALRVGAGGEGSETALVGNDLFRLADMLSLVPNALTSLSSLLGGTAMLLWLLGPSSLLGLFVMVLSILVSKRLAEVARGHIRHAMQAGAARVEICREIVDGAKMVKMQVTGLHPTHTPCASSVLYRMARATCSWMRRCGRRPTSSGSMPSALQSLAGTAASAP